MVFYLLLHSFPFFPLFYCAMFYALINKKSSRCSPVTWFPASLIGKRRKKKKPTCLTNANIKEVDILHILVDILIEGVCYLWKGLETCWFYGGKEKRAKWNHIKQWYIHLILSLYNSSSCNWREGKKKIKELSWGHLFTILFHYELPDKYLYDTCILYKTIH